MDFAYRIERLEQRAEEISDEIQATKALHERATVFTADLLERCKQAGIKNVAINARHESVPASVTFPFGAHGSIFTDEKKRQSTWPAIWGICDALGISGGAGNTNQRQIKAEAELIDGVYRLKSGKWMRVE